MTDVLTRATEALRDVSGDDADAAAATRLRLRRSLEERPRSRKLSSWLAALGIGLGATTAFALATSDTARAGWAALVRSPAPLTAAPPTDASPTAPTTIAAPSPVPTTTIATPTPPAPLAAATTTTPSTTTPTTTTTTSSTIAPTPTPPRAKTVRSTTSSPSAEAVARAERIEALFREAHELHFRGGDPAAALVAWDAYLAAEPHGRFTAEARYNRALVLVRLGRFTDARTALAPYARGEIARGYRQDEARALLDRLERLNDR